MRETTEALCASLTTALHNQMQEGFKKQLNKLHNLTHRFQGSPPRHQEIDPHKRHRVGSPQLSLASDSTSHSSAQVQTSHSSPPPQDMDLSFDSTQDLDPPPLSHSGNHQDWHQQILEGP